METWWEQGKGEGMDSFHPWGLAYQRENQQTVPLAYTVLNRLVSKAGNTIIRSPGCNASPGGASFVQFWAPHVQRGGYSGPLKTNRTISTSSFVIFLYLIFNLLLELILKHEHLCAPSLTENLTKGTEQDRIMWAETRNEDGAHKCSGFNQRYKKHVHVFEFAVQGFFVSFRTKLARIF